ncbi:hypothetical protein Dbac_0895 [Desulfomicrobium baculatum DSM 4028]|uniref:Uncharacterized protein n=2 Tax=Desulfomicrobium baculatum TaxID=899 RepID=C7LPG9_DESBD|nr:hypothetical protein Dbac_0895 [Desulfomicrobium baculatum DSM 4028]
MLPDGSQIKADPVLASVIKEILTTARDGKTCVVEMTMQILHPEGFDQKI